MVEEHQIIPIEEEGQIDNCKQTEEDLEEEDVVVMLQDTKMGMQISNVTIVRN